MLAQQINLDEYMEQRKEHIEVLHEDSKGWITLADITEGKYKQWHYKYKDLLQLVGENNYYISQNTFYSTYRRLEYIKELKALYIDLDYYNTGYSKEAILYALEQDYFKRSIPVPNLIIDSGRGLYLIWRIKAVPAQALPLWKAVEEYLYKNLKNLGADRKALDATRVLRVAGTINTKSNTVVKILEKYDYDYTLKELKEGYLPELPEKIIKKKGRPKAIVSLFNAYSLYYARIQDITVICELRLWDLRGHREEILFLYRYWNCCFIGDTEDALRMCIELNSQFVEPLQEREVVRATRSAEKVYISKDKQYKYKNITLIELLEITEEEQQHLKSIIGTKEKNRRKNETNKAYYKAQRRNDNGLTKREQEKQDKENLIKELIAKGYNKNQVAKELGLNRSTITRHYGYLFDK